MFAVPRGPRPGALGSAWHGEPPWLGGARHGDAWPAAEAVHFDA
jgi:hypothetical protein